MVDLGLNAHGSRSCGTQECGTATREECRGGSAAQLSEATSGSAVLSWNGSCVAGGDTDHPSHAARLPVLGKTYGEILTLQSRTRASVYREPAGWVVCRFGTLIPLRKRRSRCISQGDWSCEMQDHRDHAL